MAVQWDQWAATVVPIVISAGGGVLALWRQRAKEHKENREMIEAMLMERLYIIPHDHIESRLPGDENVPLTRGGIIRAPVPTNSNPRAFKRGGTA